ncbi:MAG: hypothetical protein IPK60_14480 [Sandaracinaceae bacterium]|jgi:hypothetical protein|nr:hypothetical protein [Sandaracinaceae bacterium]
MATEAVHMTALHESVHGAVEPVAGEVTSVVRRHRSLARFGAVLVDLAYFERFPIAFARYVAGAPQARSAWGDTFHEKGPTQLLEALLRRVRDGRASAQAGGPGREQVLAVCLGLASHLAVDVVSHPLVHRIAHVRSHALGTSEAQEHQVIEKFQSAIFHERYHGRDLLGRSIYFDYLDVPALEMINDDRFWRLLSECMRESLGRAPMRDEMRAWARGYRQYARIVSSPMGRLVATSRAKEEAFDVLYRGKDFNYDDVFDEARSRSRAYVEAAYAYGHGDVDRDDLEAAIPRQTPDPVHENGIWIP